MKKVKWPPLGTAWAIILGIALAVCAAGPGKDSIRIQLDSVHTGTVQGRYFLSGTFGGYSSSIDNTGDNTGNNTGDNTEAAGGLFVPIYHDGQRAESLKAIVYAKGCEFATFALDPIPRDTPPYRFTCRKLGTVSLKGVVTGHPRPWELTVRLRYVASWDHSFFEIADGFVSTFSIVEVTPDRKGNFAVQVPDFVNDGVTRFYQVQAEWSVTASEPETAGDHRYWLNAENQPGKSPGRLAIEREYPNEVRFAVLPFP